MFLNFLGWTLLIFGFAIWLAEPESWHWPDLLGSQFVLAFNFILELRPISVIFCFFLSLACFLIKKKF